jgi:plastocyanin
MFINSQKSRIVHVESMKTKIVFIVIIVFLIASCKSDNSVMPTAVTLSGLAFSPKSLTVTAGTTVTWTNKEAITHTVTSDAVLFDSGDLTNGQTYQYTFSTVGTFAYHCKYHSGMTGTIVVTAATSGTTTGTGY